MIMKVTDVKSAEGKRVLDEMHYTHCQPYFCTDFIWNEYMQMFLNEIIHCIQFLGRKFRFYFSRFS